MSDERYRYPDFTEEELAEADGDRDLMPNFAGQTFFEDTNERRDNRNAATVSVGSLYIDPQFEYSAYPLGQFDDENHVEREPVEWKRPSEIVKSLGLQPVFIDNDADRFDINQGEPGDCWFIAGVVSLVTSRQQQLIDRCIPPQQSFKHNYTGKFRFNFWHFGEWKEVVIDDMLPTVDEKLIYASNSSQPNEFWVPLMEKAYAKLYGGYSKLDGGIPADAIVDMTGGISETVDLNASATRSEELFEYLQKIMGACSTATCGILRKSTKRFAQSCFEGGHGYTVRPTPHLQLQNNPADSGIENGHAYSIIKLAVVPVRSTMRGSCFGVHIVKLICLHNPWGKHERKGPPWSDGSKEWKLVSKSIKNEIGYTNKDDGQFWMSFVDFVATFDHIWVCHLPTDPTTKSIAQTERWWQWKQFQISGTFGAKNVYEAEIEGIAIFSLMQLTMAGEKKINISFQITWASNNRTVAEITGRRREVFERLELSKDTYYIFPSAESPGDKKFLLRVFAEHISVID